MALLLLDAVHARDLSALMDAIADRAPLDVRDEHGQTALLAAVRLGQTAMVEALLDAGARTDAHDRRLATRRWAKLGAHAAPGPSGPGSLLHEAAASHRGAGVVRALVARGFELESRDVDGSTPLMLAASHGVSDRDAESPLDALLAAGASVHARDRLGHSALDAAIGLAVVKQLLAAGADPNDVASGEAPDGYPRAPIVQWSTRGHDDIVAALLAGGARPDRGRGALASAARQGHARTVERLIAHGWSPDDEAQGTTALAAAAASADVEIVEALLRAGARAFDGALHAAATNMRASAQLDQRERPGDRIAVMRALIARGATPKAPEAHGGRTTALHGAAYFGDEAIASILIEAGASVDARDALGRTPLFIAAENGCSRFAEVLLRAGADARAVCAQGTTAFHTAKASRTPPVLAELYPARGDQLGVMRLLRAAGGGPEEPQPEPAAARGPVAGARVRHAKFGGGTVVSVDNASDDTKLTIDFDGAGRKTLLARFVAAEE